jgi:DNA-binding MarR family transcriptional regulator
MPGNQDDLRRLLEELDAGDDLSQRQLSARLGIALGRVNRVLRTLIEQQWVREDRGASGRIRYVVSAEGAAARTRMTREHLGHALVSYSAVRDRVRDGLAACRGTNGAVAAKPPALALYGTGAVAHIAFACAAELGLPLIGFVDDTPCDSYLGLPVLPPGELRAMSFNGCPLDWLLVATLTEQDAVRDRLLELGLPLERVRWL